MKPWLSIGLGRPLFELYLRNQILIRTLIGASILNKMNTFLKLTSGFKFQIINSLMYQRGIRFALHDCNNYKLYCNCTNDKFQTSNCLENNICLCCNFSSLDELFRRLFTTIRHYSRLFALFALFAIRYFLFGFSGHPKNFTITAQYAVKFYIHHSRLFLKSACRLTFELKLKLKAKCSE